MAAEPFANRTNDGTDRISPFLQRLDKHFHTARVVAGIGAGGRTFIGQLLYAPGRWNRLYQPAAMTEAAYMAETPQNCQDYKLAHREKYYTGRHRGGKGQRVPWLATECETKKKLLGLEDQQQ